jgi:hypothetical protein
MKESARSKFITRGSNAWRENNKSQREYEKYEKMRRDNERKLNKRLKDGY